MDWASHTKPESLEKYSFIWSEVRLVIASIALLIGGVPPIWYLVPLPPLFGIIRVGLTLAWIISGVASGYLVYRWMEHKMLFGKKNTLDTVTFFGMVVTGVNLGIAGIFGTNIGMSILSNKLVFMIVGILYLATAGYLFKRWKESGKKIF